MSPIVTMYIWYNKCRVRTEFMWDCFVIIQSQLWIIQTAVNFLFCWILFVCRVNRTKSVIKREQNDSLLLFCWVWTDYVMFMCRQTGNLWFILIQKGREKKGWGNTLRQKGDFLGCFYSFLQKKFGYSKWKQYLCTTRTRQASSQCLNRRVVLFYYGTLYKDILITSSAGDIAAISWTPHWECRTYGELSPPHRLLQI